MSAIELLERLRRLDVSLSFDGDRLRLNAPAGVVTPELQAEIVGHKAALHALVTSAREGGMAPIPHTDRGGPLPLSATQRRMWVLHRLDPTGAAYHIVHADRLRGPLDRAALDRAWHSLVVRQESLRTRIVEADGVPAIAIDAEPRAPLRWEDLSALGPASREAALRELTAAEAHRPFDLSRGPLAELLLVRLTDEEHALVVRLHHIIADQWSLGVLKRELAFLYRQALSDEAVALPPLPVQYVDYAAWDEARSGVAARTAHLEFWRAQLRGLEPLELPALGPRSADAKPNGDRWTVTLPPALLDRVSEMASRAGATLFMALFAAYGAVLSRYTNRTDFSIGTPIAGRDRVDVESVIGAFINTLVLRVTLSPGQPFLDLLSLVKQTALEAYAHQDVPFEQLVSALTTTRQAGQTPLVQVMFNFLNMPGTSMALPGVAVESIAVDRRAAAFDLTLIVDATDQTVTAEFRSDVIPIEGVRQFVAHYVRALEAIVESPERQVSLLPIVDAGERAVIEAFNDTAMPFDRERGVEQLVADQATRTPGATAVRAGDVTLTYRELDDHASRLAARLRARGIGPDTLVGICMTRSAQLPVALLAVMQAGGAYLPLDPDLPPARLEWLLSDSRARLVLCDEVGVAALASFDVDIVRLEHESLSNQRSAYAAEAMARGAHLAYVIYTSGSTGQPKGVQISRQALANFVSGMRDRPGIGAADVLVAVTTLSFDIAALEILLPLTVGASVVMASREDVVDGHRLLGLARRSGATIMQATPTTWRLLIEAGWDGSPELKVLIGGEALPPVLAKALTARASEVWNLYGPTETTIWSTVERITKEQSVIGIGQPIANTEVYVLDESLQLAPIGVPGELCIGGEGVARGYLGRPDLTATQFVPDLYSGRAGARLYRTGDRVRLRPEGRLEYLGRLDTQIKLRGFRIELGEIEAALVEHPTVGDAAVVVHGDGDVASLVAYVTPRPGVASDEATLRAQLRTRLPAYMMPSTFVEIEALPLTPNGKIDREALRVRVPTSGARVQRHRAPRSVTEQTLAHIWSKLLMVTHVDVGDDFFELGGHSLQAMRLIAQVHDTFGVALAPAVLFSHSTLGAVAQQIDAARRPDSSAAATQPTLVPLVTNHVGIPFFWVHGVGGEVFSYMQVSEHLGTFRPVFGFAGDWSQLNGDEPLTLQRMAARYVEELRAAYPQGPYHLGGFCSAALLAFEMARQLESAGAQVGLVAALDYQLAPPRQVSHSETLRAFVRNLPLWWREDAAHSGWDDFVGRAKSAYRRAIARVGLRARENGGAGQPVDVRDLLGLWRFPEHQVSMLRMHHEALSSYTLESGSARVAVFLPSASPLFGPFLEHYDCGWHRVVDGAEEHVVAGSHTTMLMDPFAQHLAGRIEECLRRTERDLPARQEQPARTA